MGSIARNSKTSSGTTSFAAGTAARAAEVNADFDTVFNEVDGNLNDANIVAGANINPTKIGDASAADADHATTTTPGVSGAQTRPTTIEGEIEQLRHVIERLALGIDTDRNDGAAKDTFWGDLPARGDNLIANPNFVVQQTAGPTGAPDLWAVEGTPTTLAIGAKDAADGDGSLVNIVTNAADEGISQTLNGLKASTLYLITVVVEVNSGEVRLLTTGGETTGAFQDVDFNYTTTATVHTMKAVVSTDSTPTDLKVSVLGGTGTDNYDVHFVGVYECSAEHINTHGPMIVQVVDNDDSTEYDNTGWKVAGSGATGTDLTTTVYVPGPGYAIHARAIVSAESDSGTNGQLVVRLRQAVGGAAATTVAASVGPKTTAAGDGISIPLDYVNNSPTPGVDVVYTVECQSTSGNTYSSNTDFGAVDAETLDSTLTVELVRVG